MNHCIKINDEVTVGPQPNEAEIEELKCQGFRTIVNFREDGEDNQPSALLNEKGWVVAAEMEYLHLPVSPQGMSPQAVDEFREKYPYLPKPIYAHCASGKRAGAMVMMRQACQHGMSGDETLEQAKRMGFQCDKPKLMEFVKNYVDRHSHVGET
ncbi:protein tyrosine phosphatase family protein [Blastopirellula sp. JC732]|uniref:Protein tyrosine phosphatase family protein n=1 Tax=Blastopirellula sediminis TaxID=2894196 RepID=A0A9X1SGG8_9BACT|nr:protein tyrosine phosphatase family protein [Blastopirellula sediminis]MCC9607354.1 protein tyrosine phosphatase family protein [Blastopirellula sediminis]MCC9629353.1 protein tyrosine phosphatase family protein [Blastopirellula sediminis]